jgi:hypothetical protein
MPTHISLRPPWLCVSFKTVLLKHRDTEITEGKRIKANWSGVLVLSGSIRLLFRKSIWERSACQYDVTLMRRRIISCTQLGQFAWRKLSRRRRLWRLQENFARKTSTSSVLSIGVDVDHNPKCKRGNSQSFCPLLTLRVVISRTPQSRSSPTCCTQVQLSSN